LQEREFNEGFRPIERRRNKPQGMSLIDCNRNRDKFYRGASSRAKVVDALHKTLQQPRLRKGANLLQSSSEGEG
jgi:hypothetical protein